MKNCKMLKPMSNINQKMQKVCELANKVYGTSTHWLRWPNENAHTDRLVESVMADFAELEKQVKALSKSVAAAKAKYEGQFAPESRKK